MMFVPNGTVLASYTRGGRYDSVREKQKSAERSEEGRWSSPYVSEIDGKTLLGRYVLVFVVDVNVKRLFYS
jgi:hypothetical protein